MPKKAEATPTKTAAKKAAAKAASGKTAPAKSTEKPTQTPAKPAPTKPAASAPASVQSEPVVIKRPAKVEMTPWLVKQKQRIMELRDELVEAMDGVAKETVRARAEGSEASAFGMHQADAGSDAYDRDFALQLLSKDQDALYEIEESLRRIDMGTYGICEMSGKKIPQLRLEAIPFARYTVECQAQMERENPRGWGRRPSARPLFGTGSEDSEDDEEGGGTTSSKADESDDD
jgi:DnaK suppressor protein